MRGIEVGLKPFAAAGIVMTAVLPTLHAAGVLAPVPVPILLGVVAGGLVLNGAIAFVDTTKPGRLQLRIAVNALTTMAMIYVTGWGAVLAIGFAFCAVQNIMLDGRRATRPVLIWTLVALTLGEIGVALNWAPSMLDRAESHGIAVLLAASIASVIWLIDGAARERVAGTAALKRSEQRMEQLLTSAADVILVLDDQGRITFASDGVTRFTGYTPAQVVAFGRVPTVLHPGDTARAAAHWNEALHSDRGETPTVDLRIRGADGRYRWGQLTTTNLLDDPLVGGVVIDVHDITDRKRYEDELAAEARILQMIIGASSLDDILDAIARVVEANVSGAVCIVRLFDDGVLTLAAAPSVPPDLVGRIQTDTARSPQQIRDEYDGTGLALETYDYPPSPEALQLAVDIGFRVSWTLPIELPHRNAMVGTIGMVLRSEHAPTEDERRLFERLVSLAAVAIEQSLTRSELEHRAFHDELTGLPKRTAFNDRLAGALARAERAGNAVALLYLDLDRFKVVNDGLGHEAGDRLLQHIARRLLDRLRATDTIARLGGDEFGVLTEGIETDADIDAATDRVTAALSNAFDLDGHLVYVTASIGIAVGYSSSDAEFLLRGADDAMYRAKQRGRGTIERHSPVATATAAGRLSRVTALHHAVDRDELEVHYQEIVALPSRAPVAVEALVRWQHPDLGLLPPDEFIALAEDSGLIVSIGQSVLEHAIEHLRHSPLDAQVNVSARQLDDDVFLERLWDMLDEVAPERLTLEITESMLLEDSPRIVKQLHSLDALGVRLALDDFGTGYSSLVHLSRLPIRQVKIDRTFVAGIGHRNDGETLVRSLVSMARALGLEIVAEGVENQAQLDVLTEMGCAYAQGFFFSHPQIFSPPVVRLDDVRKRLSARAG